MVDTARGFARPHQGTGAYFHRTFRLSVYFCNHAICVCSGHSVALHRHTLTLYSATAYWSTKRESNPRSRLGRPVYYRCTIRACAGLSRLSSVFRERHSIFIHKNCMQQKSNGVQITLISNPVHGLPPYKTLE